MDNMFSMAAAISLVFVLFRFLDMRVIAKDKKPLKELIKEGLLVYLSVCVGMFLMQQVKNTTPSRTNVFTGDPSF